jgi:hypothetical protein
LPDFWPVLRLSVWPQVQLATRSPRACCFPWSHSRGHVTVGLRVRHPLAAPRTHDALGPAFREPGRVCIDWHHSGSEPQCRGASGRALAPGPPVQMRLERAIPGRVDVASGHENPPANQKHHHDRAERQKSHGHHGCHCRLPIHSLHFRSNRAGTVTIHMPACGSGPLPRTAAGAALALRCASQNHLHGNLTPAGRTLLTRHFTKPEHCLRRLTRTSSNTNVA